MNLSEADPAAQRLVATFRENLNKLGWVEGANLHVDAEECLEPDAPA